jgi:hypothetical protein
MNNLVVICGSGDYKLVDWMKECDVIRVSEKEVVNDCEDEKLFSYKCLVCANHEKNKRELERGKLYDTCFFVDSNGSMKTPNTHFIKPQQKSVVTFNKTKVSVRNDLEPWTDIQNVSRSGGSDVETSTIARKRNLVRENMAKIDTENKIDVSFVSTDFWYCKSVEFNALSQFYKGNHYKFMSSLWKTWLDSEGRELLTEDLVGYELFFFSYIRRLGYNFIYE